MDTDVFISRYKTDDPYHAEAYAITNALERGEIKAETSVLTLLEAASVASRMYHARKKEIAETQERRGAFVLKLLGRLAGLKVKFINLSGDVPVAVPGVEANVPRILNEATLLSLEAPLRSLDLIHLAAAKNGKEMNPELGAFVTGDGELLARKEELSRIIRIPILSPSEYRKGLGLKTY
jgi:predicted nucleic acid-binding protein